MLHVHDMHIVMVMMSIGTVNLLQQQQYVGTNLCVVLYRLVYSEQEIAFPLFCSSPYIASHSNTLLEVARALYVSDMR